MAFFVLGEVLVTLLIIAFFLHFFGVFSGE